MGCEYIDEAPETVGLMNNQQQTRRTFILSSGVALLGASLAASAFGQKAVDTLLAPDGEDPNAVLAKLGINDFLPHVGETFDVYSPEGKRLRLQLIAAENEREMRRLGLANGEVYSLLFEAPRKLFYKQDVYSFDHFSMGKFQLLLVPVGLTGRRFEAVINRTQE